MFVFSAGSRGRGDTEGSCHPPETVPRFNFYFNFLTNQILFIARKDSIHPPISMLTIQEMPMDPTRALLLDPAALVGAALEFLSAKHPL